MMSADDWIEKLGLQQHPEGGFFRETYRAAVGPDGKSYSTAIYFLLRSEDFSAFHRIAADEVWHFYAGASLTLYQLTEEGLTTSILGGQPGQTLQIVVPARTWFAAKVNEPDTFVLAGCTVAPGFDFADFELATRETLLKTFPAHERIITALTL